jgi:hypothetical protein
MAQSLTEALAEAVRAAASADEAERNRVAWNLPRPAAAKQPRRTDPASDETKAPAEGETDR